MALTEEERKARKRAYNKRYATENKDAIAAQRKAYREAHPEKVRAAKARSYAANRDATLARVAAYRDANREKIAVWQREYEKTNREKTRKWRAAYYARLSPAARLAQSRSKDAMRNAAALEAAGLRCGRCHTPLAMEFYGVRGDSRRPLFPAAGGCVCAACVSAERSNWIRSENSRRASARRAAKAAKKP